MSEIPDHDPSAARPSLSRSERRRPREILYNPFFDDIDQPVIKVDQPVEEKPPELPPTLPELVNVNWLERLTDEKDKPTGLDGALEFLYLAELSGQAAPEVVIKHIKTALQDQIKRTQAQVESEAQESTFPSITRGDQVVAEAHKKLLDNLTLFAQCSDEQLIEWWQEVKSVFGNAIQEIHSHIEEKVDPKLKSFFSRYLKKGEKISSISDRSYPMLDEQYLAYLKLTHPDRYSAINLAYNTSGISTQPKLGEQRSLLIKLSFGLNNGVAKEDSTHPVMVYPELFDPTRNALHEALHIIGDGLNPPLEAEDERGKYLIEKRGFYLMFYQEDGTLHTGRMYRAKREIPFQAFDEAAVVFIDALIKNNGLIYKALDSLGQGQMLIEPYLEAAQLLGEIVQQTDHHTFLDFYLHSDLIGWLNYLENTLGEPKTKEFMAKIKEINDRMNNAMYGDS